MLRLSPTEPIADHTEEMATTAVTHEPVEDISLTPEERRAPTDSLEASTNSLTKKKKCTKTSDHEDDEERTTSSNSTSDADADGKGKKKKKKKQERDRVSPFEIFKYADKMDITLMVIGALCAMGGGAGMPAFSFALGRLLNDLLTLDPEAQAAKSALIMVYIGIGVSVCCMVHVGCWCVAAVRQVTRLRSAYFASVMRQEIGWHDEHKPGELTARMTGDTRIVQNGINDRLSQGILNLSMGVFGFIFGFVFCWELTLVMLGVMPFVALAGASLGSVLAKASSESRKQFAVAGSIATEVMENIRTVQVFGQEKREVDRFGDAVRLSEKPGMKRELMNSLSVGSTMGLIILSYMVVFFFSSYLLIWNRTNIGDVVATFLSVLMGSVGIGFFFPSWSAFSESRAAAFILFQTIDREPMIDIEAGGAAVDSFRESVSFEHVRFAYPTRPDQVLFTDLCLTIQRGQKVAFSGASGCGKSSIIGLIQRFYDPNEGAVLVDGVDMRTLDLHQWRDHIGIVSQEPNLFAGTMIENIRVGKADATMEEIVAACKEANIHDTIMSLPSQYETPVGAVGSQLSGGQKQRIAIARALIRRPSILLLDEATSALDRKSEVEVQTALDKLMKESSMTIIIIAHRLATIRSVDCIYYVSHDGSTGSVIAEQGTYDELMDKGGLFAAMARSQGCAAPSDSRKKRDGRRESGEVDGGEGSSTTNPRYMPNQFLTQEEMERLDTEAPRTERQKIPIEELAEHEVSEKEVTPWRLLKLNRDHVWALLLGLLGSLLAGAVAPVNTILLGKLTNACANYELFGDEDALHKDMNTYAPLFLPVAMASFFGWLLQYFYGYAGEHLTTRIRTMLFRQILRQDMSFFDTPGRDAGTLSGMLSGDCEAIHQLCGPAIGIRIQTACTVAVGVVIGLCYQWKLALIATACLPFILVAALMEQMMMMGVNGEKESKNDDTLVTESLSNVRTVTSFNLLRNRRGTFDAAIKARRPRTIRRNIIVGIIYGASQFVYYGSFALCYWYGGKLMTKGEATFEQVNIASLAVLMGAMSAGEAGGFAAKMGDGRKACKRVFSIIDRVPDVDVADPSRTLVVPGLALDPTADAAPVDGKGCDITFKRVKFIYPARPAQVVLNSVSLDFATGTTNGLMGQTGCGKSTVVQLMACFYVPRCGQVLINNQYAIDLLNIRQWRRGLSIVLQEPDLFSGTVRDNIAYSIKAGKRTSSREATAPAKEGGEKVVEGNRVESSSSASDESSVHVYPHSASTPSAEATSYSADHDVDDNKEAPPTQEEIEQAARWASIHDDIMAMPEGYDTEVGYKGRALSGGQKQRVAIARGLLRRSTRLLLLDEATSALDNATEAKVQTGIEAYLAARRAAGRPVTVISIAHRLTTIRDCDQIVVLDSGVIIEQGSHEELMALGGEYKTRWELYSAGLAV